jgi:predicted HicB family RNase H-like nuclease
VDRWNTFAPVSTTDRIKRRKPANSRKESHLRVRLAEAHMAEIQAAAARAGISLSAWVTERLLRCARQESRQEKQENRHD